LVNPKNHGVRTQSAFQHLDNVLVGQQAVWNRVILSGGCSESAYKDEPEDGAQGHCTREKASPISHILFPVGTTNAPTSASLEWLQGSVNESLGVSMPQVASPCQQDTWLWQPAKVLYSLTLP
jgi:hypothetical protein